MIKLLTVWAAWRLLRTLAALAAIAAFALLLLSSADFTRARPGRAVTHVEHAARPFERRLQQALEKAFAP